MAAILFRKLHDDNHRTPLDTRVTQAKRVLCDPPAFQRERLQAEVAGALRNLAGVA